MCERERDHNLIVDQSIIHILQHLVPYYINKYSKIHILSYLVQLTLLFHFFYIKSIKSKMSFGQFASTTQFYYMVNVGVQEQDG